VNLTLEFSLENSRNISMGSGLYLVYCLKNNRFYIGEFTNVFTRLCPHFRELNAQVDNCKKFQED
jgi:predicted GIY-YIG superfamily endonuclease